jgi:Phospholipase_D-nuclease N-terminal
MPPFFDADIFSLLTTVFWVWMLIDCLFNTRARGGNKAFWFLFILFTHFFGAIIYYFAKCCLRNPVDAFPYYLRTLKQALQPSGPTMQSSVYPPPPQSAQPPPAYPYADYTQGYQAQSPARSTPPTPSGFQPYESQPVATSEAEVEYEQPMASYPEIELPPQQ